jgi:hypothetical protein
MYEFLFYYYTKSIRKPIKFYRMVTQKLFQSWGVEQRAKESFHIIN